MAPVLCWMKSGLFLSFCRASWLPEGLRSLFCELSVSEGGL